LIHQLALSALLMLGLLGLLLAIRWGVGPQALEPALWVLLPVVPFVLLREFIRRISFARLQTTAAIAVDGCVATLQLGGLVLLAWWGSLTVWAIYGVIGASCAAATLGWFAFRDLPLRPRKVRILADWRHNWSFSKWTLGSLLVANSTQILILPWFLTGAHGEAANGVLAACTALVGLANTFLVGVDNMLGPKMAHSYVSGGARELRRLGAKSTVLLSGVLAVFCLAVWLAGDQLSLAVYGSQYAATGTIVTLLTLNILAAALGMAPGNGLWALERPSSNFAASLCDMTATIAVAACLVWPWGVQGVAVAVLTGTSVGTTMRWVMFWRQLRALPVEA
jgi:O-antigen/teichoic acid export membrane protein